MRLKGELRNTFWVCFDEAAFEKLPNTTFRHVQYHFENLQVAQNSVALRLR